METAWSLGTQADQKHQEGDIPDPEDPNEQLPDTRWLSIEPRRQGVAIHAPDFYVWDRDMQQALAWASELHAALRERPLPREIP